MSRFAEPQHPLFQAINRSLDCDRRLWPQDVRLSRAHARMLARIGVLSDDELTTVLKGLDQVEAELAAGSFPFRADDEDIHMAIERRLTELVGPVGAKIHTARSRNDQVATDVAMFVRERAEAAGELLTKLMAVLLERAEEHLDWPLPSYTHLQRAQPVYLSHHLLAHFWRFDRDRRRFRNAAELADELPLGSGAAAGVTFANDRRFLATELGFSRIAENSLDAVSSRDCVLDYLAAAAICATHLSQLGAEVVLWSSAEFGFCESADRFASGSSLMPQKKNPDAAELLRAKSPRASGALAALLGVLHGLPLTYNKDLQEDKRHLFDAVDTLELALRVASEQLRALRFNRERMESAARDEFMAATDIADMLVRAGVPFREAHRRVGGLVREAVEQGVTLSQLDDATLRSRLAELDPQAVRSALALEAQLESKISAGGTALARVREQIANARQRLAAGT